MSKAAAVLQCKRTRLQIPDASVILPRLSDRTTVLSLLFSPTQPTHLLASVRRCTRSSSSATRLSYCAVRAVCTLDRLMSSSSLDLSCGEGMGIGAACGGVVRGQGGLMLCKATTTPAAGARHECRDKLAFHPSTFVTQESGLLGDCRLSHRQVSCHTGVRQGRHPTPRVMSQAHLAPEVAP